MSQQELLAALAAAFAAEQIPYMITGSLASGLQGQPRSTHDIDAVVELSEASLGRCLARFPAPRYYVSASAALDAVRRRSMFNILDTQTGDRADLWLLTGDPFDRSRFARRTADEIDGIRIFVSSPEDTILMKLRWSRESGGSARQFEDALRVYEVQEGRLDQRYLDLWADGLGVSDMLADLRRRATA